MDFVEYDQAIFILTEVKDGVRQFLEVSSILKVEINRVCRVGDLVRERSLSYLARSQQNDRSLAIQGLSDWIFGASSNHYPCILSMQWIKHKDNLYIPAAPVTLILV